MTPCDHSMCFPSCEVKDVLFVLFPNEGLCDFPWHRRGVASGGRGGSPILGVVFKLQPIRNSIKQILQKREAALPDASASRASKQSGIL